MTRNEALFYCNQWAHGGAYRLSEHAAAIAFIHYCYSDGVELVDRKIDKDTARRLDVLALKIGHRSDCCGALVKTSYVQYVDDAFYSCARCGEPCATVTVDVDNLLSKEG